MPPVTAKQHRTLLREYQRFAPFGPFQGARQFRSQAAESFLAQIRTVTYTTPMRYKALRVRGRKGPTIEKRTVTPRRPTNAAVRPREYLTGDEIKRLIETARARPGRNGHRDATMILIAYRHGLRVSELVTMRWDMLDFKHGTFHVVRRKNG